MRFYNNLVDLTKINDKKIFKISRCAGNFTDLWLSEGTEDVVESKDGEITYRTAEEGIFGYLERPVDSGDGAMVESIAFSLYTALFGFMAMHADYKLIRIWNYVPLIVKNLSQSMPDIEVYRCFNSGRYKAFQKQYGEDLRTWIIPAASAVGSPECMLKIEFFASRGESLFFENETQTPAYQYSLKYGKLPPVFSRGAICRLKGETLLITAGTASVLQEDTVHEKDLYHQIQQTLENLRILGSRPNLEKYGLWSAGARYEFGLDDLVMLRIYYKYAQDKEFIESELKKIVGPNCKLCFFNTDICRKELVIEIEGIYSKKGL